MDCKLIEELVIEAKNGNIDSKEKIVNEFIPLIFNLSSKTFIYGYEKQDIQNECFSILLKAINQYDINRHRFVAYATNAIKHCLFYLIRGSKAKRTVNGMQALTSTGQLDSLKICINSTVEDSIISICKSQELKEALQILSPFEKDIVDFIIIQNKTVREFALSRSINYSSAIKSRIHAVNKMRAYLNYKGTYLN